MKISVVVPALNEEKYIEACLNSLINQKEKADEILVIDNNSTDLTATIVKKFPVKLIKEKKQGMIQARNRGFNEAKYEIIARTDADSIVPPDWIKQIKRHFKDEDLIGLSGPGKFYDLPSIIQNSHLKTKPTLLKWITSYNKIVNKMLKHDCMYGPNYALRLSGWNKVKKEVCLKDKQVHEDLDLAIHLAPYGKIKFDNNLVVNTSVRRWKKPDAYAEYLYRGLKSVRKHKQSVLERRGRQFVKKMVTKARQMNSSANNL